MTKLESVKKAMLAASHQTLAPGACDILARAALDAVDKWEAEQDQLAHGTKSIMTGN